MDSTIFNIIEIINESFVLLAGYCLLLFTDIVPLVETRYVIGQVFFYGVIFIVVVNFCLIVGMMTTSLLKKYRLNKLKKQKLKEFQEKQREQQYASSINTSEIAIEQVPELHFPTFRKEGDCLAPEKDLEMRLNNYLEFRKAMDPSFASKSMKVTIKKV
eukprot:CAMPEP_0170507004 /NCGR_PEP_ID=MMETSP0208-20121228/57263_1 /TAXON_ID=197538 /ORGANISM="Strombidium inclinatum, Strain S3" /LENGTH=158 /DNA_ID=CAMNT_0010788923 /DNA_START=88 /DNA_END=560 /DNA_ORIENTATION=+